MANLLINAQEYLGVSKIKVPTADGNWSLFRHVTDIPSGIVDVECITSNRKQYIDLGRPLAFTFESSGTNTYELYIRFSFASIGGIKMVFGANKPQDNNMLYCENNILKSARVVNSANKTFTAGDILEYKEVNGTVYVNGESKGTSTYTNLSDSNNLYLFGKNKNGSIETGTMPDMSLYEFYYKENDEDVVHLLPSVDEDGTACLYDTVSGNYLYNAGTGDFGYTTVDGMVVAPV